MPPMLNVLKKARRVLESYNVGKGDKVSICYIKNKSVIKPVRNTAKTGPYAGNTLFGVSGDGNCISNISSTSIECSNDVFGDPYPGESKKCIVAFHNLIK